MNLDHVVVSITYSQISPIVEIFGPLPFLLIHTLHIKASRMRTLNVIIKQFKSSTLESRDFVQQLFQKIICFLRR